MLETTDSYITIWLMQLLALYLTRSEQCRLMSTQTNPSYKLIDPSGQLWFTFRNSKKKIVPDEFVSRFVQFIRSSSTAFSPRTLFFGSKFSKKHQVMSCFCQPQK